LTLARARARCSEVSCEAATCHHAPPMCVSDKDSGCESGSGCECESECESECGSGCESESECEFVRSHREREGRETEGRERET